MYRTDRNYIPLRSLVAGDNIPDLLLSVTALTLLVGTPILDKPAYHPLQGTGGGVQVVQNIPG